ncbi:MAG: AIR synthase related protein [bacterium]|nr:AIR synthase related protein [bacterium]
MDFEKKMIKKINEILPGGKSRLTSVFESDSELVELTREHILFTMDEFSAEDLFLDSNPYKLGWNMAIGGVCDILASGGEPVYYAHSMVTAARWDEEYIKNFATGISDVLSKLGIVFIGGDFGRGTDWRYTTVVIGRPSGNRLTRFGAKPGDLIYISGEVGRGNIEAALKLNESDQRLTPFLEDTGNKFELRYRESLLIKEFASTCIDTSDGVLNAAQTIAENNNTGFILENIPYLESGLKLSSILSIPKELLAMGECGEYELLFTIDPKKENDFTEKALKENLKFFKLGYLKPPGKNILFSKDKEIDLSDFNIRARDFIAVQNYLETVINFINTGKVNN